MTKLLSLNTGKQKTMNFLIEKLSEKQKSTQKDASSPSKPTGAITVRTETSEESPPTLSDIEIPLSTPGLRNGGLAVLLSEASNLLEEQDCHALRCLGEVAPVTK